MERIDPERNAAHSVRDTYYPAISDMTETRDVRGAFREQAQWCQQLGSAFTARLCAALADDLADDTGIGCEILGWRGDPGARADALPLRVAGALHALVRAGREPALAALYPPSPLPGGAALAQACRQAFDRHPAHFREFLAVAPQTNEVARSAVLMAGLLYFTREFEVPLHLFEIGASGGLNLILDRYRYRFGSSTYGEAHAGLELAPAWTGHPPPVNFPLRVASRQGSDIAPLDLAQPHPRARLMAYVWPDQAERLARLQAAIDIAQRDPVHIESSEAADWVERRLPPEPSHDGARVLFHSTVWRYLGPAARQRIEARLAACGQAATRQRPLGWLRFELDDDGAGASLLLTRWPGGDTVRIATSQPHVRSVAYLL